MYPFTANAGYVQMTDLKLLRVGGGQMFGTASECQNNRRSRRDGDAGGSVEDLLERQAEVISKQADALVRMQEAITKLQQQK